MEVSKIKLNSGDEMPILGLGTWQSTDEKELHDAIVHAIKIGYRHIDTAAIYGNEKLVGKSLKAAMDEFGVKREEMFIVTKLWCTEHDPKRVEAACRQSLSDLGLDYLDLYLIHWPVAWALDSTLENVKVDDTQDLVDTWKAMEELVDKKLVRNIGVSNYNSKQVQLIVENCKIKPATNQVECHPYLSGAKLKAFCEKLGVPLTAYSPLGAPARPVIDPENKILLQDPTLAEIAKKHGKSSAQVAIKWQVQRGCVVIPKSVKPSRVEENGMVGDFELSKEEMEQIDGLDCNLRYLDTGAFNLFGASKNYPFNDEF